MANEAPPLRWTIAHGVVAAYSAACDGDARDHATRVHVMARWGAPQECIVANQVHGTRVVRVDPGQGAPDADGLVTTARAAIGAFGADCPALAIAAPSAIAIAHCGWRGTAGGIVRALVEALAEAAPQDPRASWGALIGPSIAGCDYQVDAPVLSARTWPPGALTPQDGRHALLDLGEAIAADCVALGVGRPRRAMINTYADARLHSHRRAGPGIPQLMAIWRA